mgnify:CR=1 FL=1
MNTLNGQPNYALDFSMPNTFQPNQGVNWMSMQNYAPGAMNQNVPTEALVPQQNQGIMASIQNWLSNGGEIGGSSAFGKTTFAPDGSPVQNPGWVGQGLSALQGLGNMSLAMDNADMQRKEFAMQKGLMNRNLDSQARTVNEQLGLRAEAKGSLQGVTGDALSQYTDNYVKQHGINGSPI